MQQMQTQMNGIKREFQTKHQMLAWRQYATIEHKWYRIIEMDIDNNTLFVKRLFDTDECKYNNKVLNLVTASAKQGEKGRKRRKIEA